MVFSKFYDIIWFNFFGGLFFQFQVSGFDIIVFQVVVCGVLLVYFVYIFVIVFYEMVQMMQLIVEYGKGKGCLYGKLGKYGQVQYGCGYVQLIWDVNYECVDKEFGFSGWLFKNFDLVFDFVIVVKIMFMGM